MDGWMDARVRAQACMGANVWSAGVWAQGCVGAGVWTQGVWVAGMRAQGCVRAGVWAQGVCVCARATANRCVRRGVDTSHFTPFALTTHSHAQSAQWPLARAA
eukprot:264309-Chlamydomonas_euryale.AAC.1